MEQQTELKDTLKELKEIRAQAKAEAKGLPAGSAPVEAAPEEVAAEAAPEAQDAAPPAPAPEPEEEILLNGKTFKTQKEAFAYAEELEREKMLLEAHNQGLREGIQHRPAVAQPAQAPEEDNFDEQFYLNPKEALKKVKEEAKAEALAVIDAKDKEERAWAKFSSLNPDLAESRPEVMRILQENWEVLGKMTDENRAMNILAQKTRAYFDQIVERRKPRTELRSTQAQVVSPTGGARPGVTPTQRTAAPLTMAQQLKSLKGRSS